MKVKINKHTNRLDWFTFDFLSVEDCDKFSKFFGERFPEADTYLGKHFDYFKGSQIHISFKTELEADIFNFFWLSNNRVVEING